ncbi:MAG: transketolase, partial [Delftia sp.]|nr:transketolase [Delftia sp.]
SHDSIGLGEDGPTHQPVEHTTALRIIPNLVVIRPADANETVAAWKTALERRDGPTALILSRQKLPLVSPADQDGVARGAYVLAEAEGGAADVVLIATGSEVQLALAAREQLAQEGVAARVVSMPSCELFDAQPDDYRAAVLPPDTPRLAIEAGITMAWARYLGAQGRAIGLDRFGASAPAGVLFEKFGFTVENVVKQAQGLVG